MVFKKTTQNSISPETPDLLFRQLPRRKYPDVLPHQKDMMQRYVVEALNKSDVALQLPTGSGKTLVGLLIGEWRRRKYGEKIVYLCPTRQLVNQVVTQAEEKYGLSVVGFTGSNQEYQPSSKTKYNQHECVAITTYSSLFNTNPYFDDADIIIVDDAHSAENYVAQLWTLTINRFDNEILHGLLSEVFKDELDTVSYTYLTGQWEGDLTSSWVDKISTPTLLKKHDDICEILDANVGDTDLKYPWSMLRKHLKACHIYLTSTEIVIRPLIAPTWEHYAFEKAKQRIYMSATLGEGGDLERLLGRKKIYRLPVPDGWDLQGVGRRFFIFPTLSLEHEKTIELRRSLMKKVDRSIVLVPNDFMRNELAEDVESNLSHDVYSAEDIEQSKKAFVESSEAVAVVANRYDGIDFPGDECRLLFIDGLPKAVNAQEKFLMKRMGANVLFNERVQTRVLQAIGRCTRSMEDYSAVVVTGDELPDYLSDPRRRKHFHPELQSELKFGVEQSKNCTIENFEENFDFFISNGDEWEEANKSIVEKRGECHKEPFLGIVQLENAVGYEVEYQIAIWQEDYVQALAKAESVLGVLVDPDLKGYRALWEYLAGSTALLAAKNSKPNLLPKAKEHFNRAKKAVIGIPWLIKLSELDEDSQFEKENNYNKLANLQVENIEQVLSSLGTVHDRKYASREKEILNGLTSSDSFENAHKLLGSHLGFNAEKVESPASPDPWWQIGKFCLVFEDHVDAKSTSSLSATKARQVSSHPNWIKENVASCKSDDVEILPVLITPVSKVERGANVHLNGVSLWNSNEFISWAKNAMSIVRELRTTFVEGDIVWRAIAVEKLESNKIDMKSLFEMLSKMSAKNVLGEN